MKNKFYLALILLLSFIFMGEVKANEITFRWLTYTNNDLTNINQFYGKQLTFGSSSNTQVITQEFFLDNKSVPQNYNTLIFQGLLAIEGSSISDKYECQSVATIDGVTWCTRYSYTYSPIYSIAVSIKQNGGSERYYCDIEQNNETFVAKCPLQNSDIHSIAISVTRSSMGQTTYPFLGITRDVYFEKDYQQETNNKLDNIDSSINSSNTSGGESAADDLKNNSAFQDNSGLSSVVSMPLTFVNSLSNTCQPISLNIPYFDVDMQIPCFQSIITEKMPTLANIIKIVINGFIIYRVLLDIFQIIRNAKNPEDDRIEVLDL